MVSAMRVQYERAGVAQIIPMHAAQGVLGGKRRRGRFHGPQGTKSPPPLRLGESDIRRTLISRSQV